MKNFTKAFLAIAVIFFINLMQMHAYASYSGFLYKCGIDDYMMVPARGVFQSMGAEVKWFGDTQKIEIYKGNLKIILQVNKTNAVVNGINKEMPVAPIIRNSFTFLPLRFISEVIGGDKVKWNGAAQTAAIPYDGGYIYIRAVDYNINPISFVQSIDGIKASVVKIPYNSAYRPDIVLANNRVGSTQSLYDMAQYHGASVAINGTFFSAYGGYPNPYNTIIKDGKVIHYGDVGTVFGFTSDGSVKMEKLRISIAGATDGLYKWPNNWYAYGFNHMPKKDGSSAYIFTPEWGLKLGFDYGTNIVVENGKVVNIVKNQDIDIPSNGYVINLYGSEEYLSKVFSVGKSVEYKIEFNDDKGNSVDWSDVVTAVGAGPTLVKDGEISVDPAGEGFTEAKILTLSYARSAIGATEQGDILLVTVPGATIEKLAQVMKSLGAYNAMNLDGGASSGLYLNGSYLTKPGRNLSNSLIFVK